MSRRKSGECRRQALHELVDLIPLHRLLVHYFLHGSCSSVPQIQPQQLKDRKQRRGGEREREGEREESYVREREESYIREREGEREKEKGRERERERERERGAAEIIISYDHYQ